MLRENYIYALKSYVKLFGSMAFVVYVGCYLDRMNALRYTRFRDKSALFGRELQPGEPPSWP